MTTYTELHDDYEKLRERYMDLLNKYEDAVETCTEISKQRDAFRNSCLEAQRIAREIIEQRDMLRFRLVVWRTLARKFARVRSIDRWSRRICGDEPGYVYTRTSEQWDRFAKSSVESATGREY